MNTIQLVARFAVHEGKLNEFKQVAEKCMEATRKEEGNLQYDYFSNHDESEFVVMEKYKDSDAVMAHMGNLGDLLGQLFANADFTLEVYGNPSETLANAAAGFKPKVYLHHGGK